MKKIRIIPTPENIILMMDTYEYAIADGFTHFRKSDGRYLETSRQITEAVLTEGEIIVYSPEMAREFIRKVRFATSSPALAHP